MAMVELKCPVCRKKFLRKPYEVRRNAELGRANLCSRKCWATYVNLTEAKLANTKEILAERNADQYRRKNPNWKGGRSVKGGHPLKPLPKKGERAG